MKTLRALVTFVVLLFTFTTPASAQSVRTISWEEFLNGSGMTFEEGSQGWEFKYAGRSLYDYFVVEVPAGTLSVRHFSGMASNDDVAVTLFVADPKITVRFKRTNGEVGEVVGTVRLLYMNMCTLEEKEGGCAAKIRTLLKEGVHIQSLGVANAADYEKTGRFTSEPIFSFLINRTGRFDR